MFSLAAKQEGVRARNKLLQLSPPVGGLNAAATLANMPVTDAVILENFVAYPDRLEMRYGCANHLTGLANGAQSLHVWTGGTTSSLWVTTNAGVFNASAAGAAGAAVIALTNGMTQGGLLSTGGTYYLTLVNGTDSAVQYNGTTWSSIAAFAGVNTNVLIGVEVYRQRYYFIEEGSLNLHYLAVNAASGASTSYPLGAIFRRGGALVGIATWTIDAGNGPDDHLVIATSEGEIAVFAGTDPASPSAWTLRGVYYVGVPLGLKSMVKYGGDVVLLSETGIYPLSRALLTASIDRTRSLSEKIRQSFNTLVSQYKGNAGWEVISHPDAPFLLVNIPDGSLGTQLVMHSQSGSWTKFSGWPAKCWARFNEELYYGTDDGRVVKAWTGAADFGANITATMLQAFSTFGLPRQKQATMARPLFVATGTFQYTIGLAQDFAPDDPTLNIVQTNTSTAALWGTGIWGSSLWTSSDQLTKDWRAITDRPSLYKAFFLQIQSNTARVSLQNTDLLFNMQGTF